MRIVLQSFMGLMLLVLSSCADTEWPQWISGEPRQAELDAYNGPIPMPDSSTENKKWPNLADVPDTPKVILNTEKKDLLVSEMKDNNAQGLEEIAQYNKDNPPVVKPKPAVKKPPAKKVVKKKKKKKAHHNAAK